MSLCTLEFRLCMIKSNQKNKISIKFNYSEKAKKVRQSSTYTTKQCQIKSRRWAKFLWPSQNSLTLFGYPNNAF